MEVNLQIESIGAHRLLKHPKENDLFLTCIKFIGEEKGQFMGALFWHSQSLYITRHIKQDIVCLIPSGSNEISLQVFCFRGTVKLIYTRYITEAHEFTVNGVCVIYNHNWKIIDLIKFD